MRERTGTGLRRSAEAWRALVEGFCGSGLSLPRYCAREGIGIASYHRWRRLLGSPPRRAVARAALSAASVAVAPAFVDLGALSGASARVELRLELGGGVILQIARG